MIWTSVLSSAGWTGELLSEHTLLCWETHDSMAYVYLSIESFRCCSLI